MEIAAGPAPTPRARALVRLLAAGSAVAILVLVVLVVVHASTGYGWLLLPVESAAVAFAALALGAGVAGVYHAWTAYPQHRGAVALICVITAATFLAHVYVMGSPPAYTTKSVSGPVGGTFSDGNLNVSSSLVGNFLTVTVEARTNYDSSGIQCCAIADPVFVNSSGALTGPGFASPPSLGSPLAPGETAVGSWAVAKEVTSLNLTYDLLGCYSLAQQEYGCVMDEIYYVPEGMGILAGQQCSTASSAPSNCHMEHPPLSPALIAAGMAILGEYNSAGWRLFPGLLGTLSVPLLFGIAWRLSGNKRLALIASSLLALDVMFFAQSGGALLDVPQVFFALAAFLAYLAGVRWWKFDKYVVAGVLLGLSGLAKETGVFLVLAFISWVLVSEGGATRRNLLNVLKVSAVVGVVFVAGVQAYDSTLATAVPTFVQHVQYILSYGSGLNGGCPWGCGWTNGALPGYITPFDWVLYYSPVGYFVTNISNCSGSTCSSYVGVGYYGVTNFLVTWTVYVWVPLVIFEAYRYLRSRKPDPDSLPAGMSGDMKLGVFALVFFSWTYLPYIPLFLAGRVTYPFYFVPAIPAMALGTSWWATRDYFPRRLLAVYLAMVFVFFLVYFPDKSFLPVWARVLLRH